MTERAEKYLADILQAIQMAENFAEGVTGFAAYQRDLKTKSAIERQLGIIGEAVNQFRKEESNIKLNYTRQMVDFRNRLIHSYDNIDDAIVWTILRKHLPTLREEVEQIMSR